MLTRAFMGMAVSAAALAVGLAGVLPAMADAPALKSIGEEVFLGRSLTGEACHLRLLQRRARPRSSRLGIFCRGAEIAAGEVVTLAADGTPASALATDSDWQRRFEPELACAEAQEVHILHDVPAALRRCTKRDGGWPWLVLAATAGGRSYLLSGLASVYPLLEEAVVFLSQAGAGDGKGEVGGSVGDAIARLEAQVGASFAMIGVQDLAAFDKLRLLGHQYNSAKDYAGAEDSWRRALEIQERLLGGAAAQAIAMMAARLASGSPDIADKTRSLQDLRARLTALRQGLAAEMSKSKRQRDRRREAGLKGEIVEQTRAVQAIEAALEAALPRYAQLISPRPLDPVAVGALLRPDEAVIAFFVGADATVAFLVHGGRLRVNAVNLSEVNLHRVVAELRAGVNWTVNYGLDFDTRLSHKLYQILLGEFADDLARVRHLLIVPSGPLTSLPPGILVTEPVDGDPTDYASVAWLIRKHAVSVLPSLHTIKAMRTQMTAPRASRPFIGFGAPDFVGAAQDNTALDTLGRQCLGKGTGAVRSLVRSLPALPETGPELRAIAASLGAGAEAVRLGDKASEAAVHDAGLKDYRVVAFATHGLLPETLACDMEPALALTPRDDGGAGGDGLLLASEIAALQLDAEVALLSACDTAGPDGRLGGESLSGLARAFLYAGARRVLASHWSVFSVPTVRLTTGLFKRIGRFPKQGYAEALRRSQLLLLDDPEMTHPVLWAPFVMIGDGGAAFN